MAASAATSGFGVTLGYADTSGGSYTQIGEITALDGWGWTVDSIETTHTGSPGAHREKIPGLGNGKEISVTVNYVETEMTALELIRQVKKFFKITAPGSSTFICEGFITDLSASFPIDDRMTVTLSITLSGAPDFTAV